MTLALPCRYDDLPRAGAKHLLLLLDGPEADWLAAAAAWRALLPACRLTIGVPASAAAGLIDDVGKHGDATVTLHGLARNTLSHADIHTIDALSSAVDWVVSAVPYDSYGEVVKRQLERALLPFLRSTNAIYLIHDPVYRVIRPAGAGVVNDRLRKRPLRLAIYRFAVQTILMAAAYASRRPVAGWKAVKFRDRPLLSGGFDRNPKQIQNIRIGPSLGLDLSQLLLWPMPKLVRLANELTRKTASFRGGETVVFRVRAGGSGFTGPLEADLAALLSPWIVVQRIEAEGEQGDRTFVVTGLRVQNVATFAFHCDPMSLPTPEICDWLIRKNAGAIVFLSPGGEAGISKREIDRLRKTNVIEFGLDVSDPRSERHFRASKYRTKLAPVAVLLPPRLENKSWPDYYAALNARGVRLDASYSFDGDDGTFDRFSLPGPYVVRGGYFPQPFDRRFPAAEVDEDEHKVAIATRLVCEQGVSSLARQWTQLGETDLAQFAERIDQIYRVRFHSQALQAVSPYYDFVHIYNWKQARFWQRTVLLDVGNASKAAMADLAFFASLAEDPSAGLRLTSPRDYLNAVFEEAGARLLNSHAASLDIQRKEHAYLEGAAHLDELPADAENFANFMPTSLGRALEIGSGFGVLAAHLAARSETYICLDLRADWQAAAKGHPQVTGLCADVHYLPFADNSFDTIVANNVVEHFASPLRGLKELWRVLRPDGRLYILFPLDGLNPDRELLAHHWKADVPSLKAGLEAAGLKVVRLEMLDLALLGMAGAFPSCKGFVAKVEATR